MKTQNLQELGGKVNIHQCNYLIIFLLYNIPAVHVSTQCVLTYLQGQGAHSQNGPVQSPDIEFSFPETAVLGPCSALQDMQNEFIALPTERHENTQNPFSPFCYVFSSPR